jgi:hypothetical protein
VLEEDLSDEEADSSSEGVGGTAVGDTGSGQMGVEGLSGQD